jgi:AraC-like DNA-binding protein
MPGPRVVVIVETGPPLWLHDPADELRTQHFPGGFVAGLDDRSTLTSHAGSQAGIQLDLRPAGARHLFGLPLKELHGCVLPLQELLPREQRGLCQQLAETRGVAARLDLVQRLLCTRIEASPVDTRVTEWAVQRIEASGGNLDLRGLARELGYSQKHVISLFHEQVGMSPMRFARVVRFDRLVRHLRSGGGEPLAELAVQFGWFDQAHLANDLRRITGLPAALARRAIVGPAAGVNSFQDAGGHGG